MAEILWYSGRLTPTQLDQVTTWLNDKYGVISTAPPADPAPPTVSGTASEGSALHANAGTWSGHQPISYAYQWQRCDTAGQSCADIGGATSQDYTATSADVGSTLRVVVTGTNTYGSATASSDATGVVAQAPPAGTSAPSVSGTAREGSTLTADHGSWSGSAPISYAYQWRRCDSGGGSCADVAGATGSTYTAVSADVGSTLLVRVTASNGQGQASADSAPTGIVRSASSAAPPPVTQGLELWFNADDQSYADGAPVTKWTDDSGNGRDLTAFDAGAAPTYRANAINGHAAIEFDGVSSLLKTYGSTFTINQPDTFFIVYRALDTQEAYVWDSRDSSVRQLLGQGPNKDMEMYANVDLIDTNLTWPMPSFELWDGTFQGDTSTLYRDGAKVATGATGSSGLSGFTVGGLSTSGQWGYNRSHSYVAEILVYSGALSAPDRAAVESWLNAKYDLY